MIVLGFLMVPLAVLFKAYGMRESKFYKDRIVRAFTSRIMWPWSNEEEGIGHYDTLNFLGLTIKFEKISSKIVYSECIRNPANNLRFVPLISLKIDPTKVKFIGSFGSYKDNLPKEVVKKYDSNEELFWSLTWQGLYSNIRVHLKIFNWRFRFWLGWKIYPEDIYGLPSWSHRNVSAGFATQFKKIN